MPSFTERNEDRKANHPRRPVAFLIESELRVIAHCRKLLMAEGLASEDRQRLEAVLMKPEAV